MFEYELPTARVNAHAIANDRTFFLFFLTSDSACGSSLCCGICACMHVHACVCREQLEAETEREWRAYLAFFSRTAAPLRVAAAALAQLDALSSLALLAGTPGYARPRVVEGEEEGGGAAGKSGRGGGAGARARCPRLEIYGGRHPLVLCPALLSYALRCDAMRRVCAAEVRRMS